MLDKLKEKLLDVQSKSVGQALSSDKTNQVVPHGIEEEKKGGSTSLNFTNDRTLQNVNFEMLKKKRAFMCGHDNSLAPV